MSQMLHAQTPTITVIDSRTLVLQRVALYRNDADSIALPRASLQRFDAAGRLIAAQDPRLTSPNLQTIYNLSGQVLFNDSVDAGWRLALFGEAGQAVASWDGRGSQRQVDHDELLRPLAVTEQGQVVERVTYGGPDAAEHNQCNQLIRHDDTAGTRLFADYGLLGSTLTEDRHFLLNVEFPDWPLSLAERDALVETKGLHAAWTFNALGESLSQTDAMDNTRHFAQTVAGELKSVSLVLAGNDQSATLVDEIRYNAFAQVEREHAGNGVISQYVYDPQDGRLNELHATLPGQPSLQHLNYAYDPVGNILQIEDAAQPVRFFANQRIEPINHYRYDTLYQLIEATGREVKTGSSHGPALPDLQNLPPDPDQIANYTQHYDYDAGGNLLQMRHVGGQTSRTMHIAPDSNRSLPEGEVEVDFESGFDANGNLLQLVRGQNLSWNARNQLQQITTVQRAEEPDDTERYVYDGQGQRCRKVSSAKAASRTLLNEVRYLPGLEIRTTADGEILHVITVQAGRNSVRVLHWQAGKPSEISNDQLRYCLSDHLGSSTLELDHLGQLLSQESYYPFGGTSWWAARSSVEAKYKTVRYSGKERDASGLYYYGFRYYAPWLYRWINPDPAGDVDGLNFFRFNANSPINYKDAMGLTKYKSKFDFTELNVRLRRGTINSRGLTELQNRSPKAAEQLLVAMVYATTATNEAIKILENPSTARQYAALTSRILGRKSVDSQLLLEKFKTLNAAALKYKNDKTEQLVTIQSNVATELAFIVKNDPHERVFFTESGLRQSPKTLAMAFIHELTHLTLDTEDFYYYQKGYTLNPKSPGDSEEAYDVAEGLHDSKLAAVSGKNVPKQTLAAVFGSHRPAEIEHALQADKTLRSNALLQNADTLTLLIFSYAYSVLWRKDLDRQVS
ncbi:RHS repeat-associated core domain-containing protein [Pseudomonas sp. G.S.17]|uniref:RHS repeat domain-containing protein n=1 Tax=Pseudomonas sp. G.S.17 TaxID=3137451 RepID=UPI00311CD0A1